MVFFNIYDMKLNKKSMKHIKLFENFNGNYLIIVDVQPAFKKFFTDKYLQKLKEYASKYTNVYQIWDNHYQGHNVDSDYLYDKKPDLPINGDLYEFPNQKELVEKRYLGPNTNIDYYKKILDPKIYKNIKNKEVNKKLKRGEYFLTLENTIIVYIGNNHNWFHVPYKLYNLLKNLSNKEVTMVGGSDQECFLDTETTAISLGVKVKRDFQYIYSAKHCPI